jgi:ribonuclease HI
LYYTWGHGNVSNNILQAYSLSKGLDITKEEGLKTLIILGDSILVIRAMVGSLDPGSNALSVLISRIQKMFVIFDKVTFFHIK